MSASEHAEAASVPRRALAALAALVRRLVDHHVSRAASAMAFGFFLGLIPLIALMGALAARFADAHTIESLATPLLDVAPGDAAVVAREQFRRLADSDASLAPAAIVGFLWISSNGAHTAIAALYTIAGAARRPWIRTRAMAVAFVLLALLVVGGTTTAVVLVERSFVAGLLSRHAAFVGRSVAAFASFGATIVTVAALYRLTQGRSGGTARVWPGAVLAVAAFAGASWAFSTYVRTLGRFAAFYGGLAAVAMLLTWLWLTSFALLVGAELNALLDERAARAAAALRPTSPLAPAEPRRT